MKNIDILIRNELSKQFKNKAFWVSTLGIPLLMATIFFVAHTFFSNADSSPSNLTSGMNEYDKRIIIAVLLWLIVSFGILLNIIRASQNLFEEKNSKILEVLFTSVSPTEFITARIISSIIVGSVQYLSSIIVLIIILLITGAEKGLSVFSLEDIVIWIIVFFIFFELGMLFYTSLSFLSIVVFKNVHSIQSGQILMALIVILPILFILNILRNPSSCLVNMLIYNPFSSAFVYPTKVVITQFQIWEFAISTIVIISSSLFILTLISRIIKRVILVR